MSPIDEDADSGGEEEEGKEETKEEEEEETKEEEEEEEAPSKDLMTLNPEDPSYTVPSSEEEMGEVQKNLSGRIKPKERLAYILLLAMGILQFDIDETEPYKKYQEMAKESKGRARGKFQSLRATKEMIASEMKRRHPEHKPNTRNTKINDLVSELYSVHFELTDDVDIKYVKYEEREARKVVQEVVDNADKKPAAKDREAFVSKADRMRMICCFQDDAVVQAYKLSQEVWNRQQLDARNSTQRQPNFYDLIVAKFNDESWVPKSMALPDLHEDFAEEMEWPKRPEYTLTEAKTKEVFAWFKARITDILRKYHASGNGTIIVDDSLQLGEDDPEEDGDLPLNYGHFDLEQANTKGGDDRKNFLCGKPSDILYWWHVLDDLQVITMTCVALKKGIGVTSDKRPQSIASMKAAKRAKTERDETATMGSAFTAMREDIQNLDKTFKGMAKSIDNRMKESRLAALKKEQVELSKELYVTCKDADEAYKKVLRDRLDEIAQLIDD
jgi:hypothetical protein